jgi:flagellar biosynthesis GTPase FlhF
MADAEIERYLAQPPYWGWSHVRDNATVKRLCGPTAKFDPERKMWSTRCLDGLRQLVASKKWKPVGVREEAYGPFLRAAVAAREKAEAEWKAEEERRAKEQAAKVAAEAIKTQREREAAEREAKKRKAKEKEEAEKEAKRQKRLEQEAKAAANQKPKRDGIAPSDAEVAECARLGFTEEAIAYSRKLPELGPSGSLSDEGRVLRYCLLTRDPDESVRELTREERARSWGGREVRWTLPEAASRDYAAKLHEQALQAAIEGGAVHA